MIKKKKEKRIVPVERVKRSIHSNRNYINPETKKKQKSEQRCKEHDSLPESGLPVLEKTSKFQYEWNSGDFEPSSPLHLWGR